MAALGCGLARNCICIGGLSVVSPVNSQLTEASPQVVIIGGGRIGRAFLQMAGQSASLVRRGERVAFGEGPVLVATHCSQLDDVLQQTPKCRWDDLVFLQNGMLQQWLHQHDLQGNTQAILYMSAAEGKGIGESKSLSGEPIQVASGGRESLLWGRWASVVVDMMQRSGLPAAVVASHESFLDRAVEKILWSSIFWVLSCALGRLPVGCIAPDYRVDIHNLVQELLPIAMKSKATDEMVNSIVEEYCRYCMAIETAVPSLDMAVSEFDWRNGWILREEISPYHVSWLCRAWKKSNCHDLGAILSSFICKGFL